MSKEMTPKDALKQLNNFISREKHIDSERNKTINKCVDTLNQALDRFELLENKNQELKEKLNINFEDCADELCEALTQRDKLYDENLELQKENQELKEKAKKYDEIVNLKTTPNVIEKSLADYMNKCIALEKENQDLKLTNQVYIEESTKLIEQYKQLKQENQDLKNKNAALKIKVRAWEIQSEKYKKVINILKDKLNIRLHILTNTDGSKIYEIEFIFTYYSTIYEITQQEYELLKEFLESV